ncbi:MAG: DUF935 family protein [Synechococcaceae cyanobacterium SM1_2_3]|nr:DUF935 family protein [Synechococcaceae cyanobacterium SM1_2_3]
MPTLLDRAMSWMGYVKAEEKSRPKNYLNQLLLANPQLQTGEQFVRNPSLLLARKTMRILDDMRRDDMVKASMALKKQFVVAGGYSIESPEGQADDWEVTEFVQAALERIEGSFQDSILQILTAFEYGYSVTEKVFEYGEAPRAKDTPTEDESQDLKQKGPGIGHNRPPAEFATADVTSAKRLWLKKMVTVAPHQIAFATNPQGDVIAIGQGSNPNESALANAPLGKFIHFVWDGEFGNPYGRSDLEAAHRPWLLKAQAYQWLGIMLERFGIPPIFVHYDANAIPEPVQGALKTAIQNWQAGGWAVFPRGEDADSVTFWTPEMAGQVGTVFIPAFDMLNRDIARALLMPGLLGMTPDVQEGSYARAQTHFDVFMLIVEHARRQAADMVNGQIIKPIVDLNFPNVPDYPKFKFLPLGEDVSETLLQTWGTLTGQRIVQTTPADEDHVRKSMKFPARDVAQKSLAGAEDQAGLYGPGTDPNRDPNHPLHPDNVAKRGASLPGDAGDNGDSKKPPPKKNVQTFAEPSDVRRVPTPIENKVNWTRIERDFDDLTVAYNQRLADAFAEMQDAIEKDIRANWKPTLAFATGYTKLPKTGTLLEGVTAMLKEGFDRGRASLLTEVPQAVRKNADATLPDADLSDALEFLRAKAFWVTGVHDSRVLEDVRQALLQGVSNGETLAEIMERLRTIFKPYVAGTVDANGVLLTPARLETIVRTNLTDVYNQGRLVEGERHVEFLQGWQYSAIMTRAPPKCADTWTERCSRPMTRGACRCARRVTTTAGPSWCPSSWARNSKAAAS